MMQIEAKAQKGPRAEQNRKREIEIGVGIAGAGSIKTSERGNEKTRPEFYSGRVYT